MKGSPAPRVSAASCRRSRASRRRTTTTIVITFKQVFTPALYDVGEQMIVPEHIWKDVEDPITFLNENPVGTGPFTGVGAFQPQYYEVLKNPNYWQEGKPYIDGFRAPLYPNNDSANLALVGGEIDQASNFVPDIENTYVAKDPEHFHYWFPAVGSDRSPLHQHHQGAL